MKPEWAYPYWELDQCLKSDMDWGVDRCKRELQLQLWMPSLKLPFSARELVLHILQQIYYRSWISDGAGSQVRYEPTCCAQASQLLNRWPSWFIKGFLFWWRWYIIDGEISVWLWGRWGNREWCWMHSKWSSLSRFMYWCRNMFESEQ